MSKELCTIVLSLWNDFAKKHNYPIQKKLNSKINNKIISRSRIDKEFLRNIIDDWEFIHANCRTSEWGEELDLFQFMRSTVYLKALNISKSLEEVE